MADEKLDVEVVSVDKQVWSGEATFVRARTVDGEIGILPGHWDHLSVLVPGGVVDIREGETSTLAAVHGGFLLVHDNTVRILAETAELAEDIDVSRARSSLERARSSDDEHAEEAAQRAEARLRAAGESD
ncbi:MAG: F-type H+-transporting ATPase subunit epsilon [Solirubrobacteraceae bacterium]|nr:F-type H+-transporting ATPase subunit epsilon [Solirubrobacteraceae bacterium]